MDLSDLLVYAHNNDSSDIHISSNNPPIFRINGDMIPLKVSALKSEEVKTIIYSIMSEKQRSDYEEFLEIDFAVHFGNKRFRINAFNTINGPAAALRSIPSEIKTLEEVDAPKIFTSFASLDKGLVLVTGPTGSGKSTTMASLIDHINRNYCRHILTIEDPIEFVHKSQKSLINQREIGIHSNSFARALKSALREDPDVILIGELRDLETINLALTAAETGHLVIGTLHTSSAAQTVDRIINVFPSDAQEMIKNMLSNSIEGIISQKLLKKANGSGRIAAYEILTASSAIRNLIKEGKIPQIYSLMQINAQNGMRIMKDSVNELFNKKIISQETARSALNVVEYDKGSQAVQNKGF